MPIFHDIVERPPSQPRDPPAVADDDSQQPLHHFGPVWRESRRKHTQTKPTNPVNDETRSGSPQGGRPLSRGELIERIKRGTSPTWSFKNGFAKRSSDRASSPREMSRQRDIPTTLLPALELDESPKRSDHDRGWDNEVAGMDIERPKSALHSGDFREDKAGGAGTNFTDVPMSTSPVVPWHSGFPAYFASNTATERIPYTQTRSYSQTLLPHFTLLPPTSPLVQSTYNSDLEEPTSHPIARRRARSPQKDNRRHTFSPRSLHAYGAAATNSSTPRPVPAVRRESTFPYQAHQPRRSITSLGQLSQSVSHSTPQTPLIRPRGLSNASEASPLHHAPMVGSYEESILRGRMSTTPSRPLNFVAQIGVLGKGKCRSSLRCPPHAAIPFPAVFYSYNGSAGGRIIDNQPSPYVGLIDIENNIPPPTDARDESRRRRRYASPAPTAEPDGPRHRQQLQNADASNIALKRKRDKMRKRSQSPKAPPGGCYRIPQQGQLQIIIKNPNKTAVKLFLVPYDLSDMEPGQKTFIRQRSYSAGPIIDMPLSARMNLGTDRPEAALSNAEDPRDRPVLRYLIHLHLCCTGKGRYYLYKSMRVVFANRVPDGKEKLRNEIQLPEPKYSAYKPSRESAPTHQNPATLASSSVKDLAAERAARRRSTPIDFAQHVSLDAADRIDWSAPVSSNYVKPIPFMFPSLETVHSRPASRDTNSMGSGSFPKRALSPVSGSTSSETSISSMAGVLDTAPSSSGRNDPNSAWAERRQNRLLTEPLLLHGELSILNRSSSPQGHGANKLSEGLLARQLRGLSVERDRQADPAR